MTFDRRVSIRRIKPQRRTLPLVRRANADLPFVAGQSLIGRELLLDTCVYIDVLQGRTPLEVDRMIETRIVNHSTVALAELTHLIGALDPAHPGTAGALKPLGQTIDDIPPHRLTAPSIRACGEAGMLAGLVMRLTDKIKKYRTSQRRNAVPASSRDGLRFAHSQRCGFRFFRPTPPRYGGCCFIKQRSF